MHVRMRAFMHVCCVCLCVCVFVRAPVPKTVHGLQNMRCAAASHLCNHLSSAVEPRGRC